MAVEIASETKESITGCARTEPFSKQIKKVNFHYYNSVTEDDLGLVPFKSKALELVTSKNKKPPSSSAASPNPLAASCSSPLTLTTEKPGIQYRAMKQRKKRLILKPSVIHGWGVVTLDNIQEGEMIVEYTGEIIRPRIADIREYKYEQKGIGCYMFRLDKGLILDATFSGNLARFVNHSCDPNCATRVISVEGSKKIVIIAKRDIKAGEEISYNYNFAIEDQKIPCRCGASNCRGVMN